MQGVHISSVSFLPTFLMCFMQLLNWSDNNNKDQYFTTNFFFDFFFRYLCTYATWRRKAYFGQKICFHMEQKRHWIIQIQWYILGWSCLNINDRYAHVPMTIHRNKLNVSKTPFESQLNWQRKTEWKSVLHMMDARPFRNSAVQCDFVQYLLTKAHCVKTHWAARGSMRVFGKELRVYWRGVFGECKVIERHEIKVHCQKFKKVCGSKDDWPLIIQVRKIIKNNKREMQNTSAKLPTLLQTCSTQIRLSPVFADFAARASCWDLREPSRNSAKGQEVLCKQSCRHSAAAGLTSRLADAIWAVNQRVSCNTPAFTKVGLQLLTVHSNKIILKSFFAILARTQSAVREKRWNSFTPDQRPHAFLQKQETSVLWKRSFCSLATQNSECTATFRAKSKLQILGLLGLSGGWGNSDFSGDPKYEYELSSFFGQLFPSQSEELNFWECLGECKVISKWLFACSSRSIRLTCLSVCYRSPGFLPSCICSPRPAQDPSCTTPSNIYEDMDSQVQFFCPKRVSQDVLFFSAFCVLPGENNLTKQFWQSKSKCSTCH